VKVKIGTCARRVVLSSPDRAYATTLCSALVAFARRRGCCFELASASPCPRCENGGGSARRVLSWLGVKGKLVVEMCKGKEVGGAAVAKM